MSLLALLAAGGGSLPPDPDPDPDPELPYEFPTSAPYNVPEHCITPTDDGTGQSIHPSVVDFGVAGWSGHRYWMTTTGYYQAENSRENPHIYHSDDGFTWEWPEGVTNPLDPWPGAATNNTYWYNSDSHLVHDPDTDRLILTWREVYQTVGGRQRIYARTSTDGSTWTPAVLVHEVTDDGGQMYTTAQALVRVSATEWRMYVTSGSGGPQWMRYFTASNPLGPYSSPQVLTLTGASPNGYHGEVIRIPDGRYLAIWLYAGREYPGISTDGVNFTTRPAILQGGTYGGNLQAMYKSALALDATNPSMVHVWYTTHGTWGRWICYTRVPLTAWTG